MTYLLTFLAGLAAGMWAMRKSIKHPGYFAEKWARVRAALARSQ
jgi:hypothetical protein